MVFTFLKAKGLKTGSSLVEDDKGGVKLILPDDVVLADKFAADANTKVAKVTDIEDGWMGLDNGPESTKMIQNELSDCKTIIWNGPMGVFEMEKFAAGTNDVAKTLAACTGKGAITSCSRRASPARTCRHLECMRYLRTPDTSCRGR